MKKPVLSFLVASALAAAACAGFKTPEQRTGYSIGIRIGMDIAPIKDKIEIKEMEKGLKDEVAGKPALDEAGAQKALAGLRGGEGADKAKSGYAVGMSIGKNLKPIAAFLDIDALIKGLNDQVAGKKAKLSEEEQRAAMEELNKKQQEQRAQMGEANKAAGLAFLEANKKKDGVKTTKSGLQYLVSAQGSGRKPKSTSTVRVHYTGTLADGTKFDSSVDRGEPAEFPLNGVIAGWTEGLQLMSEGARYRFFIPSELGYGANGQGAIIGPNAVLVFDVELIKIVKY